MVFSSYPVCMAVPCIEKTYHAFTMEILMINKKLVSSNQITCMKVSTCSSISDIVRKGLRFCSLRFNKNDISL